jgi:hypothetical protein
MTIVAGRPHRVGAGLDCWSGAETAQVGAVTETSSLKRRYEDVASIAVANPVAVAGPHCDGVVGRWPLGSGALSRTLNLADAHCLLARSGDPSRPDLHRDSPRQCQRRPVIPTTLHGRPGQPIADQGARRWRAPIRVSSSHRHASDALHRHAIGPSHRQSSARLHRPAIGPYFVAPRSRTRSRMTSS